MKNTFKIIYAALLVVALPATLVAANSAPPPKAKPKPKGKAPPIHASKPKPIPAPDIANTLEGVWKGDVISDVKGGSESGVTITIRRTGPKTVTVTSDYHRLPTMIIPLGKGPDGTIFEARGMNNIFYDPRQNPAMLNVTYNAEVAWAGHRKR